MNSPKEIAENYIGIAKGKVSMSFTKTLLLGILAGMFIAFAGLASTAASVTVESASLAKLVAACVFPAGLAMVVVAGSELFTGNCLLIIGVLQKEIKVLAMLRNLVIVYFGNLIGSVIVALTAYFGSIFNNYGGKMGVAVIKAAAGKSGMGFIQAVVLGIGCNILVCIAVWMAFAAKTAGGKIACVFFPIMAFVVIGFEHSVANMYYLTAGLLAKTDAALAAEAVKNGVNTNALTVGNALINNLIPVTLGNIIGGMVFVGAVYWAVYLRKSKNA